MGLIWDRIEFEPYYYHFSKGSHVAAMHAHRTHRFFARLDIQNFFYSVGRNRVKAALKEIGIRHAEHFAKWSTVRNPFDEPRYSLPYGFPQSPILATLVLRQSMIGSTLQDFPQSICRSVYLDDIAISSNDQGELEHAFSALKEAVVGANFSLSEEKVSGPAASTSIFNCDLAFGKSDVSDARVAKFYSVAASEERAAAFESYRASVAAGNY
jgi:hypothetical protein